MRVGSNGRVWGEVCCIFAMHESTADCDKRHRYGYSIHVADRVFCQRAGKRHLDTLRHGVEHRTRQPRITDIRHISCAARRLSFLTLPYPSAHLCMQLVVLSLSAQQSNNKGNTNLPGGGMRRLRCGKILCLIAPRKHHQYRAPYRISDFLSVRNEDPAFE